MKVLLITPLLLCASGAVREAIRCDAKVGQTLTREFSHQTEMSLVSFEILVDGESMGDMGDDMSEELASETSMTVVDAITEVTEGRPTRWKRSYDSLSSAFSMEMMDPEGGDMVHESDESSALEGQAVEFVFEDGDYSARAPEGQSVDEELLSGLEAEADYAFLLPKEEVGEGDSWTLEPELFERIQSPLGDLQFADESGDGRRLHPDEDSPEAEYDGEIVATLLGGREVDGVELVAIQLDFDLSTSLDQTEMYESMGEGEVPEDLPEGMVLPEITQADESTDYRGEGTLLWNPESGRLHSLEIQLEVARSQAITLSFDDEHMSGEQEQIMNYEGVDQIEVRFDD